MTIKNELLKLLLADSARDLSGTELAERLGVSRTAVWKGINQLREEGYHIESSTNRGYRLLPIDDILSTEGIEQYLTVPQLSLTCFPTISSTNTILKGMAAEGAPEGTVLIAAEQTAGRGRMGRSFYSPSGTGLYMSFLLRPQLPAADSGMLTACAASATAEAIDMLSGEVTAIKWVNDIYLGGKKICGILTEGSVDCETGMLNYAVVGIGVNLTMPEHGFPEQLQTIAGIAFASGALPNLRCRLAAEILNRYMHYYADLSSRAFFHTYHEKSFVIGKAVNLIRPNGEAEAATVLDIAPDFSLQCRMEDGSERSVSSGEISLRLR